VDLAERIASIERVALGALSAPVTPAEERIARLVTVVVLTALALERIEATTTT